MKYLSTKFTSYFMYFVVYKKVARLPLQVKFANLFAFGKILDKCMNEPNIRTFLQKTYSKIIF